MRLLNIPLAVAALLMTAQGVRAGELSLFDVFKKACVDTNADAPSVEAVVKSMGATPHDPPRGSTTWPWPMTVESWDLSFAGRKMWVSAGTVKAKASNGHGENMISCDITSFANEDQSIAAIRDWVRVRPRETSDGDPQLYFYDLRMDGSENLPVTAKDDYKKAEADGKLWSLVLMRSRDSASLQFVHSLP